jgi:hypothetical protein
VSFSYSSTDPALADRVAYIHGDGVNVWSSNVYLPGNPKTTSTPVMVYASGASTPRWVILYRADEGASVDTPIYQSTTTNAAFPSWTTPAPLYPSAASSRAMHGPALTYEPNRNLLLAAWTDKFDGMVRLAIAVPDATPVWSAPISAPFESMSPPRLACRSGDCMLIGSAFAFGQNSVFDQGLSVFSARINFDVDAQNRIRFQEPQALASWVSTDVMGLAGTPGYFVIGVRGRHPDWSLSTIRKTSSSQLVGVTDSLGGLTTQLLAGIGLAYSSTYLETASVFLK